MLWWLSVLLSVAALALFASPLRWPRFRKQLFVSAILLLGASNLTQTVHAFLQAQDRRASALERLRNPDMPPVVVAWAEKDLLGQPSPGLLLNAVLGGVVLGAGAMALLGSRGPE